MIKDNTFFSFLAETAEKHWLEWFQQIVHAV